MPTTADERYAKAKDVLRRNRHLRCGWCKTYYNTYAHHRSIKVFWAWEAEHAQAIAAVRAELLALCDRFHEAQGAMGGEVFTFAR